MNTAKELSTHVISILKSYSDEDVKKALSYINRNKRIKGIISGNKNPLKPFESKEKINENQKPKSAHRILIDLEKNDPEKYAVLKAFETAVKNKSVLESFEDIKKLGENLSKEYVPGKSREEAARKLITFLAECTIEEIQLAIQFAGKISKKDESGDEYQRLAMYIIGEKLDQ